MEHKPRAVFHGAGLFGQYLRQEGKDNIRLVTIIYIILMEKTAELKLKNAWNMGKHKGVINNYFEQTQSKQVGGYQAIYIPGFHLAKRDPQIADGENVYVPFDPETFNFNKIL